MFKKYIEVIKESNSYFEKINHKKVKNSNMEVYFKFFELVFIMPVLCLWIVFNSISLFYIKEKFLELIQTYNVEWVGSNFEIETIEPFFYKILESGFLNDNNLSFLSQFEDRLGDLNYFLIIALSLFYCIKYLAIKIDKIKNKINFNNENNDYEFSNICTILLICVVLIPSTIILEILIFFSELSNNESVFKNEIFESLDKIELFSIHNIVFFDINFVLHSCFTIFIFITAFSLLKDSKVILNNYKIVKFYRKKKNENQIKFYKLEKEKKIIQNKIIKDEQYLISLINNKNQNKNYSDFEIKTLDELISKKINDIPTDEKILIILKHQDQKNKNKKLINS